MKREEPSTESRSLALQGTVVFRTSTAAVPFLFLCTRKEYRSKGLASRMFQAAILFCKELGLSPVCIKGVGSTLHSQRIYEKFGFETIHVLRHDEYIIDGEVIFKNTEDVESTKCYLKQL